MPPLHLYTLRTVRSFSSSSLAHIPAPSPVKSTSAPKSRFISPAKPIPTLPSPLPSSPPSHLRLPDGSYLIHHARTPILKKNLPPPIKPIIQPTYHLQQNHILEIQNYRYQKKWTVAQIAKRMNCSRLIVSKYAPMDAKRQKEVEKKEVEQWNKRGAVGRAKIIRRVMVREKEGW